MAMVTKVLMAAQAVTQEMTSRLTILFCGPLRGWAIALLSMEAIVLRMP